MHVNRTPERTSVGRNALPLADTVPKLLSTAGRRCAAALWKPPASGQLGALENSSVSGIHGLRRAYAARSGSLQ